jgi:hypothetical protein
MKQSDLQDYHSVICLDVRHRATDDEGALRQRARIVEAMKEAVKDGVTVPDVADYNGPVRHRTAEVRPDGYEGRVIDE